jgi:hypothetical protein
LHAAEARPEEARLMYLHLHLIRQRDKPLWAAVHTRTSLCMIEGRCEFVSLARGPVTASLASMVTTAPEVIAWRGRAGLKGGEPTRA